MHTFHSCFVVPLKDTLNIRKCRYTCPNRYSKNAHLHLKYLPDCLSSLHSLLIPSYKEERYDFLNTMLSKVDNSYLLERSTSCFWKTSSRFFFMDQQLTLLFFLTTLYLLIAIFQSNKSSHQVPIVTIKSYLPLSIKVLSWSCL